MEALEKTEWDRLVVTGRHYPSSGTSSQTERLDLLVFLLDSFLSLHFLCLKVSPILKVRSLTLPPYSFIFRICFNFYFMAHCRLDFPGSMFFPPKPPE